MNKAGQKRIQNIATKALRANRSKEEILDTLRNAGIIDTAGKIKSPYDQVFVQK